jgi:hypothetical protein
MKNSNDTMENGTRDLYRLVEQCLNQLRYRLLQSKNAGTEISEFIDKVCLRHNKEYNQSSRGEW